MLRVIVAEPLGCHRLVRLLEDEPDTEVVATCRDGEDALEAIREYAPDVVVLDIDMPHLDGFEVMAAASNGHRPAVIIVTAHSELAVRAWEAHAFDFLVKPIDRDRLRDAISRAAASKAQANQDDATRRALVLLEELNSRQGGRGRERLVVRTPERAFFVRADTIDWIEAAGKFVHLHVGRTVHALRESMAEMEQQLDPERFLRIGRSAIVNVDRIQEVQPWFQGDYVLILTDGTRLTSTRGYRGNMRKLLGRSA
jgi:two-component system, LytTR family, response regulator